MEWVFIILCPTENICFHRMSSYVSLFKCVVTLPLDSKTSISTLSLGFICYIYVCTSSPSHWMFTLSIPFAFSAKNWQTDRQVVQWMHFFISIRFHLKHNVRWMMTFVMSLTYESYLIMYVLNKCANVNLNNWLEPSVQIFVNSIIKK
jgi:hypothetical protein